MGRDGFAQRFTAALAEADIRIGGGRPWDIEINDDRLFGRVAREALVGLGDAYVDGWWECPRIDQFQERTLAADLPRRFERHPAVVSRVLRERLLNLQCKPAARRNGERHYSLGNDLFEAMLDRRMTYTCGYWETARTLDEAQEHKLELVCRKLDLRPGQRVLDIGCGWGSFVQYAAERWGVEAVGVTVSTEQVKLARERCAGLPVEIRLCDYRDVDERFDHIVSLGMFEHVGPKNHRAFMRVADRCLRPGGLFLLHAFFCKHSFPNTSCSEVHWMTRHIFPGGVIPSLAQLGAALDGIFNVEDLHNFGVHYDPTLLAWHENFAAAWPRLRPRYGDRFERMWRYYLLSSAAAFRVRRYQLWQLVLSREGIAGGYRAVRGAADPAAHAALAEAAVAVPSPDAPSLSGAAP